MQNTLLLDRTAWDLVLDANGDIAMASLPYSIAQDVASAIKTFIGECWYDTSQGVPYWQQILGEWPPISLVKSHLVSAAMSVPSVTSAECVVVSFKNRELTGQVQITDSDGVVSLVSF
ncbi:hypothetical protein [Yersinia alsatica]|uniref:hypothetical protein n=1 Tax=Yersinia alsatica TaxID=2890317 RepID=UPI0011A8E27D|nr:hypothetical protein [Yersinia alsatica]